MTYLNCPSSSLADGPLGCTMSLHPGTYWFNLTDSREAVITIHNLNGKQAACPAQGRYDLKVFGGDRGAAAPVEQIQNPYECTCTHSHVYWVLCMMKHINLAVSI